MLNHSFYVPESALVIAAHPDDIEFGCAGTVARWVKAGAKVAYVLCTSGDVGIAEPGMTRQKAAEIREVESRDAARVVGVEDVVFLHEPDGMLQATLELRKKLVREIRRFRPEVVMCNDPTVLFASEDYLNHPDHRAAGLAALDAAWPAAGQPNLFEELEAEGLKAHKPRRVYVTGRQQSGVYVNIEETIDLKVNALRAHKSQMGDWDPEERIKQWAAEVGKGKEMPFAEAFRVINLEDDETWAKLKQNNGG
ncbi:MAG: PIG-L family deacetylase [Chloroflexi bacterium]|jgi:LmbE family N-acetylglucosaminyl deacetylase|nr:PIG-L deacetylase family protein [Anaerolineaceae bacterium]NMB90473.1 PIG-L family deacetylase [Chloroflexota bacterium]